MREVSWRSRGHLGSFYHIRLRYAVMQWTHRNQSLGEVIVRYNFLSGLGGTRSSVFPSELIVESTTSTGDPEASGGPITQNSILADSKFSLT